MNYSFSRHHRYHLTSPMFFFNMDEFYKSTNVRGPSFSVVLICRPVVWISSRRLFVVPLCQKKERYSSYIYVASVRSWYFPGGYRIKNEWKAGYFYVYKGSFHWLSRQRSLWKGQKSMNKKRYTEEYLCWQLSYWTPGRIIRYSTYYISIQGEYSLGYVLVYILYCT